MSSSSKCQRSLTRTFLCLVLLYLLPISHAGRRRRRRQSCDRDNYACPGATCAQKGANYKGSSSGGPFSCGAGSRLKSNPASINCGASPCAANSNAAENARCCNQATCAQKTDGTIGGSFSCAVGSSPKSNPETIECVATPCAANSNATENARCCNQATCAQITDGTNGGPFTCAGSTGLKSNPELINCGATPCVANTDAAENARCCNQATCAQKTDGTIGGSFSCATGSSPKSNPETIKCRTTPCATKCYKISTGTSSNNNGYLTVLLDRGSGFEIEIESTLYTKGSTVYEKCFSNGTELAIENTHTDAWTGTITANNYPMVCTNCDSGTLTSSIVVDGGTNSGNQGDTVCLSGKRCILSHNKENVRCCNQATCAQITDGVSGGSFFCAGSTSLKSNPENIDCDATPCSADSDTENTYCCNQATCAQKTDGTIGGSFSCAAGSIPKSNPETINCGATPCAANSDAAENARCCKQATCAQIETGTSGGQFSCAIGSIPKSDLGNIECGATPCAANTDAIENIKCCSQCKYGQWQDEVNQESCKKCSVGKILKSTGESSNACVECVAGRYNPIEGHPASCLVCPSATDNGAYECDGCDPGKYKDSDDNCNVCSLGQFTDERDVNQCKDCPKGYYTNDVEYPEGEVHRNRCQECPRGTYGDQMKQETQEECKSCVAGRYSDEIGVPKQKSYELVCKACVAGKYSTDEGNDKDSNCKNCGSGTWSSAEAAKSIDACKKCGIGRYSDDVGVADQSSCKECDIGNEQTEEGKAYW
jgi:hypothetical protein